MKIVDEEHDMLKGSLPCLGNVSDIEQIVSSKQVEELIIAIDPAQHKLIENILLNKQIKKQSKLFRATKILLGMLNIMQFLMFHSSNFLMKLCLIGKN